MNVETYFSEGVWTHLHCMLGQGVLVSSRLKNQSIPSAAIFLPPPTTDRSGGRGPMGRWVGVAWMTHALHDLALSSVPREECYSAVQCVVVHGGASHTVRRPLLGPFWDLHLLYTASLHPGDRTPPPSRGALASGQHEHESQESQDLTRQGGAPGYVGSAAEWVECVLDTRGSDSSWGQW